MDRESLLSDAQWELIEPLLPAQRPVTGRPMRDHRQVVEAVIYRYRCGIAWRDLPASFGPWQTAWKRHRRFSGDGTWDKIFAALLTQADAAKEIDWTVSVDSTINRAHQHATNLPREHKADPQIVVEVAVQSGLVGQDPTARAVAGLLTGDTGGWVESQGFAGSRRSTAC